jgi:hypothetical protein
MSKNRRLRRSAPNGPCRWGCRTDNAGAVLPRSDPASIHPRIAAWYKLGKGRCQRVHSKAAGTCRIVIRHSASMCHLSYSLAPRSDRIAFFLLHCTWSAFGHKADMAFALRNVRFWG